MSIKPISPKINFSANNVNANETKTNAQEDKAPQEKTKLQKAVPYIVGAAALAVSAFAFRNKIANILGKGAKEEGAKVGDAAQEVKKGAEDAVKEGAETVQKEAPKEAQAEVAAVKEEAAQVAKEPEKPAEAAAPKPKTTEAPKPETTEAPKNPLKGVNYKNKKVVSKIKTIRQSEQKNITRILNENTHDGFVDIQMMNKVATDYMNDTQRGADRFHQAADLLEQAHVRAFIKGKPNRKAGVDEFADNLLSNPVLERAYSNMPLEESAARINSLRDIEQADGGKAVADKFFDRAAAKLTENKKVK